MPTQTTLKKYGLTAEEWQTLYDRYEGRCWCCKSPFEDEQGEKIRNSYVDHEHVKNYKNLLPEDRRKYIRGILCFQCNRLVTQKSNTIERLEQGAHYLRNYETKKKLREFIAAQDSK